jgi:Ni,Fe-hydrogenase maturation factor
VSRAFIYRHRMTGEVVVVDTETVKPRQYWKLLHSINSVELLHFIIGLTPRKRNKYIKSLTEKP